MTEHIERRMFATVRHGEVEFHICVIGPEGAIEFHFWTFRDSKFSEHPSLSPLGVETHRRCKKGEGNRPGCYLLDGDDCYHDGASLWAKEFIMPLFLTGGSNAVYPVLERKYRQDLLRLED
jgi:hypothetical protein